MAMKTPAQLRAEHPEWTDRQKLPDSMTTAHVSAFTGRHVVTLRGDIKAGRLKANQFDKGGRYMISGRALDAFIGQLAAAQARRAAAPLRQRGLRSV